MKKAQTAIARTTVASSARALKRIMDTLNLFLPD
jgi:hypothetical protein